MSRSGDRDSERQHWTWEISEDSSSQGGGQASGSANIWNQDFDDVVFAPPPDWGVSSWSSSFDTGSPLGQGIRRRGNVSKQLPVVPEREWPWESLDERGNIEEKAPPDAPMERFIKRMKGDSKEARAFRARYGDDAESVSYGIAWNTHKRRAESLEEVSKASLKSKILSMVTAIDIAKRSGNVRKEQAAHEKLLAFTQKHGIDFEDALVGGRKHLNKKNPIGRRMSGFESLDEGKVKEFLLQGQEAGAPNFRFTDRESGKWKNLNCANCSSFKSESGSGSAQKGSCKKYGNKCMGMTVCDSHSSAVGGESIVDERGNIEEAQGKSVGTKLDYIVDRKSAVTIFDRVSGKQFKIEGDEGKSLANELESSKSIKSMATTLQGYVKLLEHCGHSEGIEEARKWSRWWPEVENPKHQWSPMVGEGTHWEQSSPTKKEQRRIRRAEHKKLVAKAMRGQGSVRPIDPEEYPPIRGMEGPFQFRRGFIFYYDPKAGRYYDRKSDMYVTDEQMAYALGQRESVESIEEAQGASIGDYKNLSYKQYLTALITRVRSIFLDAKVPMSRQSIDYGKGLGKARQPGASITLGPTKIPKTGANRAFWEPAFFGVKAKDNDAWDTWAHDEDDPSLPAFQFFYKGYHGTKMWKVKADTDSHEKILSEIEKWVKGGGPYELNVAGLKKQTIRGLDKDDPKDAAMLKALRSKDWRDYLSITPSHPNDLGREPKMHIGRSRSGYKGFPASSKSKRSESIEEAGDKPNLTLRGHIGYKGKVFVYRNLHKGPRDKGPPVWSIKALSGPKKGIVIGHDTAVVVRDVRFTAGTGVAAATVRRTGVRGVHAGVVGFISDEAPKKSGTPVTYDPTKYSSFATIKGEHPVTAAKSVTLWDKGGTIWAKGAVVDKTKSAVLSQTALAEQGESLEEKWWHNEPSAERMVMRNLAAGGIPEGPAWEVSNFLREMGYTDAQLRKLLTKGGYSEDFINEVCGGGVYHPLGKNKTPLGKSRRVHKPGREEEEFSERSIVPIPGRSFSPYEKQKPG